MAAICVVGFVRAPRSHAVPARVVAGDQVTTDDGLAGTVVQRDGAFALVDAGDARLVWARAADLMAGPGLEPRIPGSSVTAPPIETGGEPAAIPPAPNAGGATGGGFTRVAGFVWSARRTICWGWLVAVLACLPLAATAEHAFVTGGFLIEDGDANRALTEVRDEFHMPVGQQVMLLEGEVDSVAPRIERIRGELLQVPFVLTVGPPRPSIDGRMTAVTVYLSAPDDASLDSYEPILAVFRTAGFRGDQVRVAGSPATNADTTSQTKHDLQKAEAIGTPLALLVLLYVFGTVVSAFIPLIVGVASVIMTLALLHLLSLPLHLSIFIMNIATMLGFGLGIDYSLLGVSRFRDELAQGVSVRDAVMTTVMTSGRAAVISGVAVLAGIAALAVIPLPVFFALAVGGVVVVGVTVFASLTLLPAMLGVLGHRVERLRVRRVTPMTSIDRSRWYRIAHAVMRRPGLSMCAGIIVLVMLASPILGARLDVPHTEVLPVDSPSMVAANMLTERFDERVDLPVVVIADTADLARLDALQVQLLGVRHIRRVEVLRVDAARGRTLLNAWGDATMSRGGATARQAAADVAALSTPMQLLVTGQGAGEQEFLEVVRHGMPKTMLLMFASTLIILTIAFRSLTLPIKAILLDTLSILASLGCVIAVFQNGVGIELLGSEPLGYTEATIPIILFCLLFGLSMDYEVFMLAKVTELYQQGHDDREATARGVAATAPLVTGAALILIVIGVAFALTQLVLVKQIGFGMAVALALDATVVRVLLLPATMRLLGPRNWWLPAGLRRRVPTVEWSH